MGGRKEKLKKIWAFALKQFSSSNEVVQLFMFFHKLLVLKKKL